MSGGTYKYLLFDADDTVLDFRTAERAAFAAMSRECGIEFTEELYSRYHVINAGLWKQIETGAITRDELKFRRYFELVGDEKLAVTMGKTYERLLGEQTAVIDGAPEVCRRLSRDYRLFIITNGLAYAQRNRIGKSEVNGIFEDLFISEEIGYAKPDPRFFDAVCDRIGDADRSHYLVIGDTISSDISGAVASGIDSCWYNPKREVSEDIKPTYTVYGLDELEAILDGKGAVYSD